MAKNSFLRSLRYAQGSILLHLYKYNYYYYHMSTQCSKSIKIICFIYLSNYKCHSLVSVKIWPIGSCIPISDRKFCCLSMQKRLNSSILTHYALKLLRHLNFIANYWNKKDFFKCLKACEQQDGSNLFSREVVCVWNCTQLEYETWVLLSHFRKVVNNFEIHIMF